MYLVCARNRRYESVFEVSSSRVFKMSFLTKFGERGVCIGFNVFALRGFVFHICEYTIEPRLECAVDWRSCGENERAGGWYARMMWVEGGVEEWRKKKWNAKITNKEVGINNKKHVQR